MCCLQFIDVRVEDAVYEANARALVRVLIGELDVDLPKSTLEGCYMVSGCSCTRERPTYCPQAP